MPEGDHTQPGGGGKGQFRAYESVWRARADKLGSVAGILSGMPNVRGAFSTSDQAAIRDTAGELWLRISDRMKETAFFLVADPEGKTIASFDNRITAAVPQQWPVVREVRPNSRARFPDSSSTRISSSSLC